MSYLTITSLPIAIFLKNVKFILVYRNANKLCFLIQFFSFLLTLISLQDLTRSNKKKNTSFEVFFNFDENDLKSDLYWINF